MIQFSCPNCHKTFQVPAELAGRRGRCKACGSVFEVPATSDAEPVVPPQSPTPVQVRRRASMGGRQGDKETRGQGDKGKGGTEARRHEGTEGKNTGNWQLATGNSSQSAIGNRQSAIPSRLPMRTRRLMADAEHMAQTFADSSIVRILSTEGDPPDLYRIEYRIQSLGPTDNPEAPQPRQTHQVEIQLTADYPRLPPMCKMLTPVFHPNIDPSHICVGDHWAAGERLVELVIRIGEMLAYQAYNIKSPLDAHAAMWADLHPDQLPTDPRTIRPAELE